MKHIIEGKFICLLFAAVVLTACNSEPEAEPEESETSEVTEEPDVDGENSEEEEDSAETTPENEEAESHKYEIVTEEEVFDESSIEALVNRQYLLSEDYVPDDLVRVEVPLIFPDHPEINQLRAPAAEALKEMFDSAEEEDIYLHARSGYRSYGTQEIQYGSFVETHGEEAASRFSAPPGASEHQTGLAMDVTSESVGYELLESFGETAEGGWVKNNAHVYGFIIRYHEGKEDITGYMYEPWHLRYVGKELAHDIKESGLTYEEYILESGIDIEENRAE
ncbi:M15 family metallopeptidase [Lacicoccus qingdaonensis]|uniref:D-alanyl-D-alanine carboxypeptidase n=1 Tax=Lacicoccus qingdaonensis TaxID=576118 RepID=A0A1G9EKK7_9BACL|nr:M15 family metallopeptidase [Salinicoccus qingdaonensis]SDK76629.1 D-alanyl-D-alanine carboxypeptidase [Salinicoccus qingdaonensis]